MTQRKALIFVRKMRTQVTLQMELQRKSALHVKRSTIRMLTPRLKIFFMLNSIEYENFPAHEC